MWLLGAIQAHDTQKTWIYLRNQLGFRVSLIIQILFYFLIFAGILFIAVGAATYFFCFQKQELTTCA
jgi:hypothetical protein